MGIETVTIKFVGIINCAFREIEKWTVYFSVSFLVAVSHGRKKRNLVLLPLLLWSWRFSLTRQRISTAVFTMNAHGHVSLTNLAALYNQEIKWKRLCLKYMQLYLHALRSWLSCAWGNHEPLLPQRTLCTKQGPFSFCHTPVIQGFGVCLFINHSKPRKAHLTKWNNLNLYSCLQVIPMSRQRQKQNILCMKCLVVRGIYTL